MGLIVACTPHQRISQTAPPIRRARWILARPAPPQMSCSCSAEDSGRSVQTTSENDIGGPAPGCDRPLDSPPPRHRPPALALREIRYRYWKLGFAHAPPAKLSRSGWTITTVAPLPAEIIGLRPDRHQRTGPDSATQCAFWLGFPRGPDLFRQWLTDRKKKRPGPSESRGGCSSRRRPLSSPNAIGWPGSCPLLENIAEDTTKISQEFWLLTGITIEFLIPTRSKSCSSKRPRP